MITLLAGIAAFERELILARTSQGRAIAKQNGMKFGPKIHAFPTSEKRSYCTQGAGRIAHRNSSQLQRQRQHHFAAQAIDDRH
jgi:DNA invertase Pin-like site-specific DNA recombinase